MFTFCLQQDKDSVGNTGPIQLPSKIGKRLRAALGCHLTQTSKESA